MGRRSGTYLRFAAVSRAKCGEGSSLLTSAWFGRLTVLADHDERRQEDRLKRHDQCQRRPRALLEHNHPQREDGRVKIHDGIDPAKAVIRSATFS